MNTLTDASISTGMRSSSKEETCRHRCGRAVRAYKFCRAEPCLRRPHQHATVQLLQGMLSALGRRHAAACQLPKAGLPWRNPLSPDCNPVLFVASHDHICPWPYVRSHSALGRPLMSLGAPLLRIFCPHCLTGHRGLRLAASTACPPGQNEQHARSAPFVRPSNAQSTADVHAPDQIYTCVSLMHVRLQQHPCPPQLHEGFETMKCNSRCSSRHAVTASPCSCACKTCHCTTGNRHSMA